MLFKEKGKGINYIQYTEDKKTVERRIKFKKDLAEEVNKLIAVFNNDSEAVKLNNSIVVNVALNCLIKQLTNLPEEEIIQVLETKALAEAKK